MDDVPDATALSEAVASLHSLLRDATRAGHQPNGAPSEWAALVAALAPLAATVEECRDLALIAARRSNASWPMLARATGIAKSTLEHRYLSAAARGIA